MFGNLNDMMGKLKDAQEKIAATKKKLDNFIITEQSNDELLEISLSANRKIKSIEINDELLTDKEKLEDYLIIYLNKAIEKATQIHENEMSAAAKEGMPSIPGMDLFK